MRVSLPAILLAAALPLAVPAVAQSLLPAPVIVPDDEEIGPDDEVVVREYLVRRPLLGPSVIVGSIPLRPGSVIPGDVDLAPFDDAPTPSLRRFGYFIAPGNKIVVVNPANRVVVRILDR